MPKFVSEPFSDNPLTSEETAYHNQPRRRRSLVKEIIIGVIVVLLVAWWALVYVGWQIPWVNARPGYQAVFLTNGQVYFGKVVRDGVSNVVIKDIYYLQVTQPLQQGTEQPAGQQQQGQLSLAKLGNELHGPVDEMRIKPNQVIFIEDLKDTGQVVQAISNFKSGVKPETKK